MLELSVSGSNIVRKSATQYTVTINAAWETYYNGAKTNYGMTASSGGGSVNLNTFGVKSSGGSGSFIGTYYMTTNGSATKSIAVTFRNYNTDNGDSATYTTTFDITVPAWTSYTVKYNANGGTSAPSSQTKWKDQTLKLSTDKPTRTGYIFKGWGTSASDTSVDYAAGANYTANAGITLYAIWEAITYTVKYNANGGYGAPSDQTKTYGATLTLSNVTPSRTSVEDNGTLTEYTFKGWSTSASSNTVAYKAGSSYTGNAAITLYAVWSRSISVSLYDVSYNTNGGSEVIPQIKIKGETLTLRSTIPVKYGYTFNGWGLSADATTVSYESGSEYTLDEDIVLYAIWTPWSHTVTFNINGGNGDLPEDFIKTTGVNVIIPESTLTKDNCIFKYWSTNATGSGGHNYYTGDGYDGIQNNGTVTLYAIWQEKKVTIYYSKKCEATAFIENSEMTCFKNNGEVYAMEFIEDETLNIGDTAFHFAELIER